MRHLPSPLWGGSTREARRGGGARLYATLSTPPPPPPPPTPQPPPTSGRGSTASMRLAPNSQLTLQHHARPALLPQPVAHVCCSGARRRRNPHAIERTRSSATQSRADHHGCNIAQNAGMMLAHASVR